MMGCIGTRSANSDCRQTSLRARGRFHWLMPTQGGLHRPDLVTSKQSLGPSYGTNVLAPTQSWPRGGGQIQRCDRNCQPSSRMSSQSWGVRIVRVEVRQGQDAGTPVTRRAARHPDPPGSPRVRSAAVIAPAPPTPPFCRRSRPGSLRGDIPQHQAGRSCRPPRSP